MVLLNACILSNQQVISDITYLIHFFCYHEKQYPTQNTKGQSTTEKRNSTRYYTNTHEIFGPIQAFRKLT